MGSETDIMQHFILNDIRRHFPECEGWRIVSREAISGYDQVVRIERRNIYGEDHVLLGFTFEKSISAALAERINSGGGSRPENSVRVRKAILVPQGSDVTGLNPGTEIFRMKKFAYDGHLLVWLNHPQHRFGRMRRTPVET
ncbi:MAG: hypothetical protein ABFC24_12890 [Methanoregulaceae archaeon]